MKFKLTTNESFLVNGYVNNQPKEVDVLRDILTLSGDSANYADGAEYDSTNKLIYLKHGNTRLSGPIDATAFIKDGMVENVTVTVPASGSHSGQTCLVITFNTDSGKEDIEIPINQIFDASNYYTKTEVNSAIVDSNPVIEDTRSTTASKITGIAPFSALVDKQRVIIHLKFLTGNSTTLELTLSNGITTTGAIPVYARTYLGGLGQIGDSMFRGGTYMELIYNSTQNRWYCLNLDRDTTTWKMSQLEINNSTDSDPRSVPTAKLLRDNFYTKSETDTALSLKQDIDDVYVDQAYVDTNTTNSFASDNKRYNIIEDITLTSNANYVFGSGCTIHFYNEGKLNGSANLKLDNTQIEAPMKQCFDLNVNFAGLMRNSECYPEWWGAAGDGVTDDSAAINRCILCACHTPVVLTAENYLVKSTIGCEESIANSAANAAAHQSSVNYQYSSQLIIKHNIIGDATLTEPVVRFAVSHGLCNIYGSIIVRNSSDDCVGFTSFPSVGGEFGASNSEIYINTIFKGDWANHYYADATYRTTYGVGNGVGAVLYQFNGKITIDYIGGFKHGVYMSRIINSVIHVGSCESTYCFYLGTPKPAWHNVNYNWYVTRNKVFLGKQVISSNKNVNYIPFITDVADSAVIKEDGTQEISLNEFTIGDSNNGNANLRHPHKHSLYYTYSSNAGHTGNKYNFNITYAIETSRKFIKFVFPSAPQSTNRGPNGDEINFGIGCFLKDIDIPYGWNVKLNNVILSNTAKTKGTYRWMGGSGEMLVDTVTVTRASTPIFNSGTTTINLLDINPQFKGSAVSVSSAPSTCDNNKFYVVDGTGVITTNGTKKYPVYYNYFGSGATLIGYTLDNYKDNDPRVPRVAVAGPTATTAMSPNTLYVFGTTGTPMTSLTITFTAGDGGVANNYHGIVYCGSDMTFNRPSDLIISENRELPTFGAGGIFEFNVLENILNFSYTEAT